MWLITPFSNCSDLIASHCNIRKLTQSTQDTLDSVSPYHTTKPHLMESPKIDGFSGRWFRKKEPGVYEDPYPPPLGAGGKVYQVCRVRISSCEEGKGISRLWGKNLTWKKGKRKQNHLPNNIKAVGKNIKFNKMGWGNVNLYTPSMSNSFYCHS